MKLEDCARQVVEDWDMLLTFHTHQPSYMEDSVEALRAALGLPQPRYLPPVPGELYDRVMYDHRP
jgi:hypothetical protein